MNPLAMLRRPGRFLVTFSVATAVLLAGWQWVSGYYLTALVWTANQILALSGAAVTLRPPATGGEMVYPVVAGALALFAVTPDRSPGWKLRWLGGLLAGLFLLHAGTLYLDARAAAVAHGGAAVQGDAAAWTWAAPIAGLADLARTQLSLALVTLTWFLTGRRAAAGDHGSGRRPETD
ncbi:MAG: hypothetical protein WDA75_18475 [Candidatus Latescibacterota bacterium]|jgi:hypothetical protein